MQSGCGDDVVIRTDPLPDDEVAESNLPFSMIVAVTPGVGVTVVVSWKLLPMIGWGVSRWTVAKPSSTPQAGPANPTCNRTKALLETTQVSAQRCAGWSVGEQVWDVVPLQDPSNCPGDVPAWAIATVSPATVIVPVRDEPDGFGATVKVTVPFPVPDVPSAIEMKAELLTAVHEQPGCVATPTVPLPPAEPKDAGLAPVTV